MKALRFIGRNLLRLLMLFPALWCFGAIYFDGPFPGSGNLILGILWVALTLFLLFIRWIPMIAMAEVKGVLPDSQPHHHHDEEHAAHAAPAAAQ